MRIQPTGARKRLGFATAALAAALLLTACGSDNDDHEPAPAPPATPAPTPAPPPVSTVDAFFTFVAARVAAMLDTDEPVAIDTVTVTSPDNTEPEAVQ